MGTEYSITDLSEAHRGAFCACLVPGEQAMLEAGDLKEKWLARRGKGDFGAKLAVSPEGVPVGMIQYIAAEGSQIEGPGLWFVFCVWVPPAKRNPGGARRRQGIGAALLRAAEEDVRARGAEGLAAWGTTIPVFMRSSFFKRRGYLKADRLGIQELVWKPFVEEAQAPRWRRDGRDKALPTSAALATGHGISPRPGAEPVAVQASVSGICPAMNAVHLRFRRAAAELGAAVSLETRENAAADAILIDGKEFPLGPPPSYERILKTLKKAAAKRGHST